MALLSTEGHAVCVHQAAIEQGFVIVIAGLRDRRIIDLDGLALIKIRTPHAGGGESTDDLHWEVVEKCSPRRWG